ncbi:hypothetical protein [Sphingomonas kyeonggiensis]|uniref:Uncharacterized protein n=1 Tax=Sphingomonas kyeonggiensis TaxID=1268553 RepID=A0A7W6NXL0_9SPHN|nr:hypothetical protein [Sphingomonas kyeonggiensis]MBB4099772.1 hypothetical protein [Sphingomonas kyeonggiensis]
MSPLAASLWVVAIALLVLKLVATIILLLRPRATRLATTQDKWLWWATKITPVIAVPCLIIAALIEQDRTGLWVWSLMMVFVAIAVPIKIGQRFGRA